jgi:SNF2 family DNA or RNA helicase
MMHTLDNFKSGALKVILLHTYHAGSGIDISCATDVCLLHALGMERIQAIGRAQRVGRTTPLTVHQLLYPAEA